MEGWRGEGLSSRSFTSASTTSFSTHFDLITLFFFSFVFRKQTCFFTLESSKGRLECACRASASVMGMEICFFFGDHETLKSTTVEMYSGPVSFALQVG